VRGAAQQVVEEGEVTVKSGSQPRLARETLGTQAFGELRRQHLHDDAPAQRHLLGHEDARHPAAAELALNAVLAAQALGQAVAEVVRGGQVGGGVGVSGRLDATARKKPSQPDGQP